jgi:hypothetical protein
MSDLPPPRHSQIPHLFEKKNNPGLDINQRTEPRKSYEKKINAPQNGRNGHQTEKLTPQTLQER